MDLESQIRRIQFKRPANRVGGARPLPGFLLDGGKRVIKIGAIRVFEFCRVGGIFLRLRGVAAVGLRPVVDLTHALTIVPPA